MGVPLELLEGTVDLNSRLFDGALKIAGWSHLFGNMAKFACNNNEKWPTLLNCVRKLCFFWRNDTWRQKVLARIKGRYPAAKKLLDHAFQARLAKWRYETIYLCFRDLLALREICQGYLRDPAAIFGEGFQDQGLLADIKTACNFDDLWIFIKKFMVKVLEPLEKARRWGLVCTCCKYLRDEFPNRKCRCPRASRRLKDARKFLEQFCDELTDGGNRLCLEDCEGCVWVLQSVSKSMRTSSLQLGAKTKKWTVPYRTAEASDPVEAAVCAAQLRSLDPEACTPLVRRHISLLTELDVLVIKK